MVNRRFIKWMTGILSATMFTYFLGLSQYVDKNYLSVTPPRLAQNQPSRLNTLKSEWRGAVGRSAGNSTSAVVRSVLDNQSQVQTGSTAIVRSRAS